MAWEVVVLLAGGHALTHALPDEASAQQSFAQLDHQLRQANPTPAWQFNWGDERFNIRLGAVVGYTMRETK